MTITTRQTTAVGVVNKNAPLTNTELDQNFVELQQGKSDVGHGHAISDVSGLQAELDSKVATSQIGTAPTPDTVVQRTATGAIRAANGVNADEAVTKSQLDAVENNKVTTNTTQTITASKVFSGASHRIQNGDFQANILGANQGGSSYTDLTLKAFYYSAAPYDFSHLPHAFAILVSDSTVNEVLIGGGTNYLSAATTIKFFAAAEKNTPSTSPIMTIDSTGVTATSLNVSGSKNFRIDNPANPDEYLYHSAIESDKPRTQYIIEIDVDETLETTHTMPDWFHGLNGNTCTVFCSPCKHFGAAYGEVLDGVLTVTANTAGKYHILVMAERSDPNVSNWKLTELKPVEEPGPDTGTATDTAS